MSAVRDLLDRFGGGRLGRGDEEPERIGNTKLLTAEEHQRRWSALAYGDRRTIIKAVNKGLPAENRAHALLAITLARRQQRFWKWAWILSPLAALLTLSQGFVAYAANTLVSLIAIGFLSWWFSSRAQRAEQANIAMLEQPKASRKNKKRKDGAAATPPPKTSRRAAAGHLPGGARVEDGSGGAPRRTFDGERMDPNTSKAKAKRRRKR